MAIASPVDRLMPLAHYWREYTPGVMISFTVAASAYYMSARLGGPVMLYALLLGMTLNFLSETEKCIPGISLSSKAILRIGVALLGLRITGGEVMALGWSTIILVIGAVIICIVAGVFIGRVFQLDKSYSVLSAGAVAICGASAALAISAVLPKGNNDGDKVEKSTLLVVVGVTALSTIAMIVYPVLVNLVGMDAKMAGIFLGATIHDVAQVVGAGYMISEETGHVAAVVKLLRVACLVPAVAIIGFWLSSSRSISGGQKSLPTIPLFLLGFVLCVLISSFDILPEMVMVFLHDISRWFLIIAVAALGMKTSLKKLISVGLMPLIALLTQTAFLAAFVFLALSYI